VINRLYIHVPFCASKCGYCAFYSLPSPKADTVDLYLQKLAHDFKTSSHLCGKLDSVFIGGGTPTFLSAQNLRILFSLIQSHFDISASAEISIECNPETLTSEKARIIANFANRVSLGVQSFNPRFRRILGRQGAVSTIEKAISLLMKNGVSNIGCDLIYAIPGQTPEDWQRDLEKAVSFPLKHISAYSLTLEEGTVLAERMTNNECRTTNNEVQNIIDTRLLAPDTRYQMSDGRRQTAEDRQLTANDRRPTTDDCSIKMWNLAGTVLKKQGFHRYEISNYAKRGFECRHNVEIWYGDKYLGFGPAAASFDGKKRWTNVSDLPKWLSGSAPEIDSIPPEKRAREIFVMGLRTSQGWNKKHFQEASGFKAETFNSELDKCNTGILPADSKSKFLFDELKAQKLIRETADRIYCTRKGLLLWNEVAEILI
jgi:oxygen-independent coproporphyrinogen-3 oxidase